MKTIAVIPARYASTRFPGKPLAPLNGKPIIAWVVHSARSVDAIDEIYVATDNDDIAKAASAAGARIFQPQGDFPSGTDRIAAAIQDVEADIVVNIQGDEPQMSYETVKRALNAVLAENEAHVGSACVKIWDRDAYLSPNVVKVVRDRYDYALFFSRSPIPSFERVEEKGLRNYELESKPDVDGDTQKIFFGWKHLGLYVYRRHVLEEFVSLSPTLFEHTEKLEQLRLLENGYKIKVVETPFDSIGVDTPEDLTALESSMRA